MEKGSVLSVCLITPTFPRFKGDMGGISVGILAEGLAEKGHSVFVITMSKVLRQRYGDHIFICHLPLIPEGFGRAIPSSIYSFCKALHLFPSVDIIHYHWTAFSPNLVGMIASEFVGKNKPCLVTVRGGDLRSGLANGFRYSIVKRMLEKVDRVVAISQGMYDIARMYNVPRERLAIIPNGVDTALFSPEANGSFVREKFNVGNSPLVVSVGFEKIKGMEHLIRAAPKLLKEISDAKFIFIGTDEKRKIELQFLARKLGVEKSVHFICSVPYYTMPSFFVAADVVATFFGTSADKVLVTEFGRVHLEAMSCGKPVIANLAKGLIEDGRTGFRVSANEDDIASALRTVLQDGKLAKQLGNNARKLILKHYSVETMTESYLQLYKELMNA